MLFVPLATIAMDPIPREKMGNATSLFSLMRNLGGSTGIAVADTLLVRDQQSYLNVLGAHVTPYDPAARALMSGARAQFLASGADPVTATQRAYGAVYGLVQRQAAMLSFMHVFLLLGLMFLALLPLTFIMRRPQPRPGGAPAH
jgi:DHA2 family multidrug resistance protein